MRRTLLLTLLAPLTLSAAQAQTPPAAPFAGPGAAPNERRQLLGELRSTPRLVEALEADPTLLSVPDYLERVNPAVADLVRQHPEIGRNPEYYLFSDLGPGDRDQALEQRLWPGSGSSPEPKIRNLIPPFVFLVIVFFVVWLLRMVVENRRWGRLMRVQADAHNRLLEKFGNAQELLAYMQSEPGRRFLESAPVDVGLAATPRVAGLAGRLLLSLQFGIVLGLAGLALLLLRNSVAGAHDPLLVFGALGLAVGGGLMLSAAISFLMARRLRLLPSPVSGGAHE